MKIRQIRRAQNQKRKACLKWVFAPFVRLMDYKKPWPWLAGEIGHIENVRMVVSKF